jgi:hypothetical protein
MVLIVHLTDFTIPYTVSEFFLPLPNEPYHSENYD